MGAIARLLELTGVLVHLRVDIIVALRTPR